VAHDLVQNLEFSEATGADELLPDALQGKFGTFGEH